MEEEEEGKKMEQRGEGGEGERKTDESFKRSCYAAVITSAKSFHGNTS